MKVFPAMGVSGNQSHRLNMWQAQSMVTTAKNMGMAANEFAEALKVVAAAFSVPIAALKVGTHGEEKKGG